MTYLPQIREAPHSFALPPLPIVRMICALLRYHRNLREVAALDDRTLRDIGASRADLCEAAWRDARSEHYMRGGL